MTLSELLKSARESKGWSMRQTSAIAGIPFGTISKMESNQLNNPTRSTLAALRRALELNDRDFLSLFDTNQ